MKTIKEYREQWAKRKGYVDWNDVIMTTSGSPTLITNIFDEIAKGYAKEVAEESLKRFYKNLPDDLEMSQLSWQQLKKAFNSPKNIPTL